MNILMQSSEAAQITWSFVSRLAPPEDERGPAYWFVFQDDKLLVRTNGELAEVPLATGPAQLGIAPTRVHYLGYLENGRLPPLDCYAAEIAPDAPLPDGMITDGLRQLNPRIGDLLFSLAGRAIQIVTWDRTHRYCGQCGTPTENLAHERAKHCPSCGLINYPRLSPAIIIAVIRRTDEGNRLLLARNHRFPSGRYSVLAGYVEPGESLEECARREVCEEVSIRIRDIRYFGSQPWPFPNSLMIGFTAEYDGGEITLEESEIAEAGWFAADALPGLPPKMTIARRLIDWFAAGGPG
jgi:NAD+ diphosphatase